ncbi:MAG: hypothetical protein JXR37_29615 [Kiritimatiellae bacterium]|nr:hypothetical protein [Kiritimatiellia bacterium]
MNGENGKTRTQARLLMLRYLDGSLPEDGVSELNVRLKATPALRRDFADLLLQSVQLVELGQEHAAETARPALAVRPEAPRHRAGAGPVPRGPARPWGWWITGIAAAVLVAIGVVFNSYWEHAGEGLAAPTLARLERVEGDVFVASRTGRGPARADQMLGPEARLITEGPAATAVLRYREATRLELAGGGTLTLEPAAGLAGAPNLVLSAGLLRASVEAAALRDALLFRTPHVDVQVVGTRFTLRVARESTRVDMDEGEVLLASRHDGRTARLRAGEYAVAGQTIVIAARPQFERTPAAAGPRVRDGLVLLYTFLEGRGRLVRDVSGFGQPLNLSISHPSEIAWLPAGGLEVRGQVMIASDQAAQKVTDACRAGNALTIEAWLTPGSLEQEGPSRIVTISRNTGSRNVMLGQEADRYVVRLRTTATTENGTPTTQTAPGTLRCTLQHIVFTRDASGRVQYYLDGAPCAAGIAPEGKASPGVTANPLRIGGDFSCWQNDYRLCLANEFLGISGYRPWLGKLHLVAVYSRALSHEEVRRNNAAGLPGTRMAGK